ncbi:hypothetical protein JTE90_020806 [Oedothorax gibbosus]|uniref:MADF domain-containing protein n=1 Tax=Oedothorax gibbosus TaxID=931172 RepID=A0AAV6U6Z4_9ARAC|nr:hypothetical protein JTE90_020806 [Oedothorax gibbosus]
MSKEYFPKYLEPSSHVVNCDPHLLRLIEEVKKYVCLYNINSLQYRDQNMKEECWNIISETLDTRPSELKKEWKRLRDGYRQALIIRKTSKNPFKRRLPLRPWKYEEKMSFLKPYMTPRRLLANPPCSENDEDEYNPLVAGEEKEEIIHKIINNIKQEVLSDEERLPQSSVRASPGTSSEHQHLESSSEIRGSIGKTKKEAGKFAGTKKKGLKRKHVVSDNDYSPKQPCVNIVVPDKDGNLTISLANDKPKPKRLRYVTFASNLPGGPSANNINHQSIRLNNPQPTNINNTTPVIIMNEKSIEKIISNFENSNNSTIAISSVIGNCTKTSNGNVVSNTTRTSSGTSDNQFAITSSGDKPSGASKTSEAFINNSSTQTNISSFFRNVGVQCEVRNIDKDGESTKKQSSVDDLKDDAVAVFVHSNPNLPSSDDESEEDGFVSRKIRVRKYRIPEFRCNPNLANTLYSGNREQVYRAVRPSISSNGTRSIELFIASIYQTIKELPWQGQNVVKTRSLEFLKVAEEEFEEVKVQWNKNGKNDSSNQQTENLDMDLATLNPSSNQENQDASSIQDTGSKEHQDASNKNSQEVSNQVNQGTRSSPGQSYDPILSLESVLSIFGDNDSRHIALRLFLASLYESMKDMPSFILSYLKANLMQLVVHVEEIYNNPDDFRNTAVNSKNGE